MKVLPLWGLADITQGYTFLGGQLCNLTVFGKKIVEAAVYIEAAPNGPDHVAAGFGAEAPTIRGQANYQVSSGISL